MWQRRTVSEEQQEKNTALQVTARIGSGLVAALHCLRASYRFLQQAVSKLNTAPLPPPQIPSPLVSSSFN